MEIPCCPQTAATAALGSLIEQDRRRHPGGNGTKPFPPTRSVPRLSALLRRSLAGMLALLGRLVVLLALLRMRRLLPALLRARTVLRVLLVLLALPILLLVRLLVLLILLILLVLLLAGSLRGLLVAHVGLQYLGCTDAWRPCAGSASTVPHWRPARQVAGRPR